MVLCAGAAAARWPARAGRSTRTLDGAADPRTVTGAPRKGAGDVRLRGQAKPQGSPG